MVNTKNPLDPSDAIALGPNGPVTVIKSMEGQYNEPGLPKPPAGYGRVIGFVDSVDGDDAGPESPDEF
jgi:hypothetical protein